MWFLVSVKPRSMARCEVVIAIFVVLFVGRLSEAALDGAVRGIAVFRKLFAGKVSVKPRSMARCEAAAQFLVMTEPEMSQ